MNLYLLETEKLGEFHVIAKSPNDAQEALEKSLDRANYGFSKERKVIVIKLIASEIKEFPKGKPNFSSGDRLLINNL